MHACPRCGQNFGSKSEVDEHFRELHRRFKPSNPGLGTQDYRFRIDRPEALEQVLEETVRKIESQLDDLDKRMENLEKTVSSKGKEYRKATEDLAQSVTDEIHSGQLDLSERILNLEKKIGQQGEQLGVPAKFRKNSDSSEVTVPLEVRIDTLEKSLQQLVTEVNSAFADVSKQIRAPHFTWTPGHGIRFERRF